MSNRNLDTHEDKVLITSVLIGDLVIGNLLYWLIFRMSVDGISDAVLRMNTAMLTVIYFACTIHHGVVLHKRRIGYHQIVMQVLSNMCKYAIFSILFFAIGGFQRMPVISYVVYLVSMTACVSLYRILTRMVLVKWRRMPQHIHNVVIVGSTDNAADLYREIMETETLGYNVLGYFDDEPNVLFPPKATYLGKPSDVIAYLDKHGEVHELYCCLPSRRSSEILPIIHYCMHNLIHFFSMPNVSNYVHHRMHFTMFGDVPCMSLYNEPLSRVENRIVKRVFDVVVSALFLFTIFPFVFVIVAVITKITMPGPIFFRQKRTGLDGNDFYCLKFRSMKVNNDADTVQATLHDPRKTKWGNIMRKTNIDELPQFINVLLGQMSIVGPRPHMVKQTNDYSKIIDYYMVRHLIKPGITGWSQVTGFRGETKELSQMEGRVRGDIWYMEHWSIWLDIYIMYKTVANVVQGDKNAY